jgi:hypothetical protein
MIWVKKFKRFLYNHKPWNRIEFLEGLYTSFWVALVIFAIELVAFLEHNYLISNEFIVLLSKPFIAFLFLYYVGRLYRRRLYKKKA